HLSILYRPSGDHLYLPSFPTRRSSDLKGANSLPAIVAASAKIWVSIVSENVWTEPSHKRKLSRSVWRLPQARLHGSKAPCPPIRSEEHTSELQSRRDLVCRLLLEKKKQ